MGLSSSARCAELVDTATGQKYEVRRPKEPGTSYGRRFSVIFDDAVAALAVDLSGTSARVLLSLPSRLDFRAWKSLRQADLGEALGLDQSAISRALRELLARRVVEKQGRGPTVRWRLCRTIGYRGTASQFHTDQRHDPDDVSHDVPPAQPALKLGPSRVINGGKNKSSLRAFRSVSSRA